MTTATLPAVDHAPRIASRNPHDFPLPTGLEEDWRFTPLPRLRGLVDGTARQTSPLTVSCVGTPGADVSIQPAREVAATHHIPSDRAAAVAMAEVTDAVVIRLPRGQQTGLTTVALTGSGGTAFGRVVIDVEAGSSGTVVLDHTGSATYSANVEITVGDGASLTLVTVQDWDRESVHLSQDHAVLGRDARLRYGAITLGGDVVRVLPRVDYAAPGGEAELLGVYFAGAGQHMEHRSFVDHSQPHCTSDVLFKGALSGVGAHSVWIGDVLVRAGAVGISTYEVNRNLILTDGARADSVPNLELETGNVAGAGHASATGRFDEEQLFYLQSRGIPSDEAHRLVVLGFLADVVQRIGVDGLADRVIATVSARLDAS